MLENQKIVVCINLSIIIFTRNGGCQPFSRLRKRLIETHNQMGCGAFGLVFIKSRGSEFVDGNEKGRIFSLMSSSESISQGVSGLFFSWIFNSTVGCSVANIT